ncbi:MAG TPA: hypothetical protein VKD90_23770 [Gemmataceae bacterium]|nr:hypothetical protein [Gemmataceae bacterium]
MVKRSTTDLGLLLLGMLGWAAAVVLVAAFPTTDADVALASGGTKTVRSVNTVAAGAAGGFAIGGGLCFLGAAIAARSNRSGGVGPPAA